MKKLICVLLLVVVLASMLTACGKFTCDSCKEEKTGKKYKVEVMGEKAEICKDCNEKLEELKDALT